MLQISLSNFAEKLSQQTGKNITIQQTAPQQITAHYLMNVKLDFIGHGDHSLRFHYTLPFGAGMILALLSNVQNKKFTLHINQKMVDVNLNAFSAYRNDLSGKKITQVDLQNGVFHIYTENVA